MPTILERSKDTDAVIKVLRGVNDEISYFDLANRSRLTPERVKQVLHSARRILMNEKIVFDVKRGEGLVRLFDGDKANLPHRRMRRANRQAHYGMKELNTIEQPNRLPLAVQTIVSTARTIFSLIKNQTRPSGQRPLPK